MFFVLTVYAKQEITVTTCLDEILFKYHPDGTVASSNQHINRMENVLNTMDIKLDDSKRANFSRCTKLLRDGKIGILYGLDTNQDWENDVKFIHI